MNGLRPITICLISSLLVSFLVYGQETEIADHSVSALLTNNLKTAVYAWQPYIYQDSSRLDNPFQGLDVELTREAFKRANIDIQILPERSWGELITQLREGEIDFIISALDKEARRQFAYYSDPFRTSVNVLYFHKNHEGNFHFDSHENFLQTIVEENLVLGIVEGFSYDGGGAIDSFIGDRVHASHFVSFHRDPELFNALEQRKIDGFIIDEIVGASLTQQLTMGRLIHRYPIEISRKNYFVIFSKASVAHEAVQMFNDGLQSMRKDGTYLELNKRFLFPVLLSFMTNTSWYFYIELFGVMVFALGGVMMALRGGFDLFGILFFGFAAGLGGGVVRDLLANREELAVAANPPFLYATVFIITITTLISLLLRCIRGRSQSASLFRGTSLSQRSKRWIGWGDEIFNAIGLSTLSLTGVVVALEVESNPLWFWGPLLAALTSTAGGMICQAIARSERISAVQGVFYAEIALVWGLAFSLFLEVYTNRLFYDPKDIFHAVLITLAGTFFTRLIIAFLHIKSPVIISSARAGET